MNEATFTPQAAVLWAAIPLAAQQRILANVFCHQCQDSVQIVNFTGDVKNHGDIILKGKCVVCGNEVDHLVESSEHPLQNN